MTKSPFIGREPELDALLGAMIQATNRRGSIALIEGGPGIGKSTLVEELQKRLACDARIPSVKTVIGYCYEGGTESSYYPFIESISQLASEGPSRSVGKLTLELIRQVGPDLLRIIPVLGDAAAAGLKAVSVTAEWWLAATPKEGESLTQTIPLQFTDTIVAIAEEQGPILLILEDIHAADGASAQLLLRLSHRIGNVPILIVATCRRDEALQNPIAPSRRELIGTDKTMLLTLEPFTKQEISQFVTVSYGADLAGPLAPWLYEMSGGQPLFVASYLRLLEERALLRRGSALPSDWSLKGEVEALPIPESVYAVVQARLAKLSEDEHSALQHCAVQGQRFYDAIVAQTTGRTEAEIRRLLKNIASREELVAIRPSEPWSEEWTDTFAFSDQLLQRVLYDELTSRERADIHKIIGLSLKSKLDLAKSPPPVDVLIRTADHLLESRLWESSGAILLEAARASHDQAAFRDTTQLCERALQAFGKLADADLPADSRKARAQCVQLLLLSSELRWWGGARDSCESPLDLLDRASADAQASGDTKLSAQMTFLRARVAIVRESLPAALELYRQAVAEAAAAGDDLGEVVSMSEYGHHQVGADLTQGLLTLQTAYEKWKVLQPSLEGTVSTPILARYQHKLQGTIGVAHYDDGNFDEAERWLRTATDTLRNRRMPDLHSILANFLAQLYVSEGRFEEAERVLLETLEVLRSETDAIIHRAYNTSLLGKTYLEWGEMTKAAEAMIRAYESSRHAVNEAVLPLIRNYYCELLIHPKSPMGNHAAAASMLESTILETSSSGFSRSEVSARVLLARLFLDKGREREALKHTRKAVEILEEHRGVLPALRSEEVLFTHASALEKVGHLAGGRNFRSKAEEIVRRKAKSISDESRRYVFLTRVPLNQEIMGPQGRAFS